jgi:hypothetical protein
LWNLGFQNSSGAAQIVADGGMDPLIELLTNGSDEQKFLAAGTIGFLDHDIHTKAIVAENGGIAALLMFIKDAKDDVDTLEGLVALRRLCGSGSRVVCDSLSAANGASILSTIAESSNEKHRELASAILTIEEEMLC